MKMKFIMQKKATGGRIKSGEPSHIKGESNISNIPKYIGLRENRKGPD